MSRQDLLLPSLLLVVFAAYSLGFSGPFLFDDFAALKANRLLQFDPLVLDQWRTAAISSRSGLLGRPIAMFSFAINAALGDGINPYWIKLVNTVIHCSIGVVVYHLAQRIFAITLPAQASASPRLLAILAAAIWLLHPLQVSTVLYSVQRMAQLATLFTGLGLLVFVHYRSQWARHGATTGDFIAANMWLLLLLLLAAYSKENGALLPFLIATIEICFFKGMWAGRRIPWLNWAAIASLALLFLGAALILAFPPDYLLGQYAGREFTLYERVLTQARLLWHYLYWLLIPNISAMGFQHDDVLASRSMIEPMTTALSIIAWAVALCIATVWRERLPMLLFALLFFLVGHFLESGLWPLEMAYEHRNYLPSIAVCMFVAYLIGSLVSRYLQGVARYAAGLVPLMLLMLLLIRVDTWSDELRLAGVNARNHPESARSNYFYANALLNRYRSAQDNNLSPEQRGEALAGARYYFERMYRLNPRDVAGLVMLHSLDSRFMADHPERPDWLGELTTVLQSRPLQPSDRNAIDALIACVNAGGCAAEDERVLSLLDTLEARYPNQMKVIGWRFDYLLGHAAPEAELEAVIARALALRPGRREYLYRRIQLQAKREDVGGMYESTRAWLEHDTSRLSLHTLKGLFATPQSENLK